MFYCMAREVVPKAKRTPRGKKTNYLTEYKPANGDPGTCARHIHQVV